VEIPDGLRYTDDHEWLRLEAEDAVVGITAYAAGELGDVVFVELPAVGTKVAKSQAFGVIESVKTASDLYSPAAGEIIAVNDALADRPELVNDDPYGAGWLIRVRLDDPASAPEGLRDAGSYRELIEAA
jgi:glycine cleavage system H protein